MAEKQQEKKQGFFSKIVNGVNSGYSKVRMTRSIARQFGKQVGKKAALQGGRVLATEGTLALVSNPAGWILLGVGLVILIVIMFFLFLPGAPSVNGGDLSNLPTPSGNTSASPGATLAPGQKPIIVSYCQGASQWQFTPCGNLTSYGCGPTSMAMLSSSLGIQETPSDIAKIFLQAGVGDYPSRNGALCSAFGLKGTDPFASAAIPWVKQNFQVAQNIGASSNFTQQAKKYIDSGYLLYAGSTNWPGVGGHQVMITDADPNADTITVRDPNCSSANGPGERTVSGASGLRWYAVYPIKRK